jgi:Cu/Ag efflux protein CusF
MHMMNLSRRFLLAVALAGMPVAFAHGQAKPVPVQGEVMRVNSAEGKVTLRHGPIPNLDMKGCPAWSSRSPIPPNSRA